jgi:RNA polymerase sigma factor FliA
MTYAARKHALVRRTDDVDALIHAHLQLVRRLAWHVHGRISSASEIEELVQAGMVALVEAAHAFEDRGFEFSTYASVRIKGAMIDHLRRGSGQSRGASSARRVIEAARNAVESTKSGPATAPEIAEQIGVPLDTYFRMEADTRTGTQEPLDDVYSDDSLTFCDAHERQDEVIERRSGHEVLRDAILTLDKRRPCHQHRRGACLPDQERGAGQIACVRVTRRLPLKPTRNRHCSCDDRRRTDQLRQTATPADATNGSPIRNARVATSGSIAAKSSVAGPKLNAKHKLP